MPLHCLYCCVLNLAKRVKDKRKASIYLFIQERKLADALSVSETWQSRHAQEVKDLSKLKIELSALNR